MIQKLDPVFCLLDEICHPPTFSKPWGLVDVLMALVSKSSINWLATMVLMVDPIAAPWAFL